MRQTSALPFVVLVACAGESPATHTPRPESGGQSRDAGAEVRCAIKLEVGRGSRPEVPMYRGEPLWSRGGDDAAGGTFHDEAFPDDLASVQAVTFGVCSLWPGDIKPIGRISPGAYATLGPVSLTRFLILTETIKTYLHIGAELCIEAARQHEGGTIVSVRGHHSLCTNGCREDPLAFSVIVEPSGVIRVRSDNPGKKPADLETLRTKEGCPS